MRILRPLTDLVKVGPYPANASTGSGNLGSDTDAFREYITLGHQYRIQCNGTLTRIKVGGPTTVSGQSFYLRIWRKTEANRYLLVGTTGDLIGQITANTVSTVTISPGIEVQEGDFVGYRLDGVGTTAWHTLTGQSSVSTARVAATTPPTAGYAWESQTVTSGDVMVIETHMQAPDMLIIGDSIMAGHPDHFSFFEATDTTQPERCIEFTLRLRCQGVVNAGIGSQTTTQISARFAADAVAYKPRYAIINGGVNDIAGGALTATIVANYTSMVAAAVAAGILPAILLILPWTNGTTGQMQQRDTINGQLVTLAAANPGSVVVDMGPTVGLFRSGGDGGNFWDINPLYTDGDGVHYNPLGYYTIAQGIIAALTA